MLKKNFKLDDHVHIVVGDVYFSVVKLGDKGLSLIVDAPPEMPITFGKGNGKPQASARKEEES